MNLPRGIRYEARYKRYRVRKYIDGKAYLGGDWATIREATEALKILERRLKKLERVPNTLGGRAAFLRMSN